MMKSLAKENKGVLIELSALERMGNKDKVDKGLEHLNELPNVVRSMLQKFSVVFEPLEALLPERLHEHTIELQPGAGPMNV